jgi:hypothetical protein
MLHAAVESPMASVSPLAESEMPAKLHAALCAGAKSSASTWLFNVVAEVLRERDSADEASYFHNYDTPRRAGENVKQFYADTTEAFPRFDAFADYLVIQTQRPSQSLCSFAIRTEIPVVMTIREPRDAIVSLMKRFAYSFESAFKAVAAGNEQMLRLHQSGAPFVLRYEDRFYDREETVGAVARFLGVDLSPAIQRHIFNSLTREEVSKKIETLRTKGVFGSFIRPVRYAPETRWQLGHIGDITIGQFAEVLTRAQQQRVGAASAGYCSEFGYPSDIVTS